VAYRDGPITPAKFGQASNLPQGVFQQFFCDGAPVCFLRGVCAAVQAHGTLIRRQDDYRRMTRRFGVVSQVVELDFLDQY